MLRKTKTQYKYINKTDKKYFLPYVTDYCYNDWVQLPYDKLAGYFSWRDGRELMRWKRNNILDFIVII